MISAIWLGARTLISGNGLMIAAIAAGVIWFALHDVSRYRAGVQAGKAEAHAETREANDNAARYAERVRSRARRVRRKPGERDPYSID